MAVKLEYILWGLIVLIILFFELGGPILDARYNMTGILEDAYDPLTSQTRLSLSDRECEALVNLRPWYGTLNIYPFLMIIIPPLLVSSPQFQKFIPNKTVNYCVIVHLFWLMSLLWIRMLIEIGDGGLRHISQGPYVDMASCALEITNTHWLFLGAIIPTYALGGFIGMIYTGLFVIIRNLIKKLGCHTH